MFEVELTGTTDEHVRKSPLRVGYEFIDGLGKRAVDVSISAVLLVCLSPVFLILALLIAADGGPVFFAHRRVGRDGTAFGCWKFRTMLIGAEECLTEYLRYHPHAKAEWGEYQKLQYDPRITSIGSLLRKTSLDEIPQLWNVLKGEMSLVGPRPVTAVEMRRYGNFSGLVTSIRPGITGSWQVTGRNEVTFSQRVKMDMEYVMTRTLVGDVIILVRTIPVVFARTGAR
jgi:lipopolysaccharide/colanic/teichoic acid biosynthesis glycosyltransferase